MKIRKASVTEQIIEYISENIENGTWPVGAKIMSEPELAAELGVSRPSIRVAIRQFIALGVLESKHGKGTFVKRSPRTTTLFERPVLTCEESLAIGDIVEFRMLIEPYAAYMAARFMTEEDQKTLRMYYEKMEETTEEPKKYFEYDRCFHETIIKSLGNRFVEESLKELFNETFVTHVHIREQLGHKPGLYYHGQILEAIEKRNPDIAYSVMKEHLQMKSEQIPSALKKIKSGGLKGDGE